MSFLDRLAEWLLTAVGLVFMVAVLIVQLLCVLAVLALPVLAAVWLLQQVL